LLAAIVGVVVVVVAGAAADKKRTDVIIQVTGAGLASAPVTTSTD